MMNISRELKVTTNNNYSINITVRLVEVDGHPATTLLEVHLHDPICYAVAEDPYLRCDMVGQRKEEYQRMKLERVVSGLVSMIRDQITYCLEAGGAFHE
jgi:hypothetical protein